MDAGKVVLFVLAVVGVIAVCAAVYRQVWTALMWGNPLTMLVMFVAVFLLGVVLGYSMRR